MRFSIIIIGLCAMSIMSCPTGDPAHKENENVQQKNENLPQLKAEWEQQFAMWKALNIQDYQFVYIIIATGIYQKITVKNGVCESAINIYDNEPDSPHFKTIDAIFDLINGAFFTEENFDYPPGQIETWFSIYYNPQYHYPVEYSQILIFDQSYGYVGGNGVTIEITDFTPLEDE